MARSYARIQFALFLLFGATVSGGAGAQDQTGKLDLQGRTLA